MSIYNQLVKYPVFTIDQVEKQTGNTKTAYYHLERLIKMGLVKKIRNNIYSAVDPESGLIIGTRYQIACAITDTAYISHHSAFEYYGITDHVLNDVYVSSESKYNSFVYNKVNYKYLASRMQEGIFTTIAQRPEEIDLEHAERDRQEAEAIIREEAEELQIQNYQILLRRSLVRIEVSLHLEDNESFEADEDV